MKKRTKLLATGLGAALALSALAKVSSEYVDLYNTTIPVQTSNGTLQVPVYGILHQKPWRCSSYVRKTAQELFGKNYSHSDAWNRRHNDRLVARVGNSSLEELSDRGILKPGMIVGAHSPNSHFNGRKDVRGKPVEYTHVLIYLGNNTEGKPLFADQFGAKTAVKTERQMREAGLTPIEIITSKK